MKNLLTAIALIVLIAPLSAQLPAYVPTQGLQAFWDFSGNPNDVSGNSRHGTANGVTLTTDRFNNPAQAYHFDGINDFISTTYAGILGTNSRAISFWAKTNNATKQMSCVAWGGNTQASRYQAGFNYVATGALIDGAYGAITYQTPAAVNDNQWHHYVYQFSNPQLSMVEVYQDGIKLTTPAHSYNSTNTLNTISSFSVQFGRIIYSPSPAFFDGDMDDIGIWDRTLSACEINQLFTSSVLSAVMSHTNVSCFGDNNGAAQVVASGVSSPYTYTWQPSGFNGTSVTGLPAGQYSVIVRSAKNCETSTVVTISEPAVLTASVAVSSSTACPGTTVNFTATPSGGTGPYTFTWLGTTGSSSVYSVSQAVPGSYSSTVQVTDGNNCISTQSAQVSFVECLETTVPENRSGQLAALFPNPTKDIVLVKLNSAAVVTICDITGKEIYSTNLEGGDATIDLRAFPEGLYFINVENNGRVTTRKLIKE